MSEKYMTFDDYYLWDTIDCKEIKKSSKIKCPNCKKEIPICEWYKRQFNCETCGSHDGIECPNCAEGIDLIHDDDLEIINEIKGDKND